MFTPNITCFVISVSGKTNVYGAPVPGVRHKEGCSIIEFSLRNEKSAVRADSSATRGNANEYEAEVVLLLTKNTKAKIDDLIEVEGDTVRIMRLQPVRNVRGVISHFHVEATFWSD